MKIGVIGEPEAVGLPETGIHLLEPEYVELQDIPGDDSIRRKELAGFRFQFRNEEYDWIAITFFPKNPVFWADFIEEFKKLLKPGGRILVKVPREMRKRVDEAIKNKGWKECSPSCSGLPLKHCGHKGGTCFRKPDLFGDFLRTIESSTCRPEKERQEPSLGRKSPKPVIMVLAGVFHRQYLQRFIFLKRMARYHYLLISKQPVKLVKKDIRSAFDEILHYASLPELKYMLSRGNYDLIHAFTEPYFLPLLALRFGRAPVVTEIHDFRTFRFEPPGKYQSQFDVKCEKEYFSRSQAVLYKTDPFSMDYLTRRLKVPVLGHQVTASVKPPGKLRKRRYPKGRPVRLVYAGGVFPEPGPNALYGGSAIWPWIEEILKQDFEFHIYPKLHIQEIDRKRYSRLWKLRDKYPNLVFHPNVPQKQLFRECMHYDYGAAFFFTLNCQRTVVFQSTQISGKEFLYASMGMPVLVNRENYYTSQMVRKYGIGYSLRLEDLPRLNDILQEKDYAGMVANTRKIYPGIFHEQGTEEDRCDIQRSVEIARP